MTRSMQGWKQGSKFGPGALFVRRFDSIYCNKKINFGLKRRTYSAGRGADSALTSAADAKQVRISIA